MTSFSFILDLEREYEEEDEDERMLLTAASILVIGEEQARMERAARRQQSRIYLTRSVLLPDPRENTPWTALFNSQDDRAFITTMGFDVATFNHILTSGFGVRWYSENIPRPDSGGTGEPRPGGRSLDAAGALGLTLHYLNSTMREISLQQIFALIPSTTSRYITHCLDLLLDTLTRMDDAKVKWPSSREQFVYYNRLITQRHPRLHGAFASIDGLSLLQQESKDHDIENASYNGWTATHNTSSVLVFSPEGDIIANNLNCPGSWHDSRVAIPIYDILREHTPDGFYIVADSAFPKGAADIHGRIVAPLKASSQIVGTAEEIQEALAFNRELLSYRQTAEWGNRALQGSFGRLRIPLEANDVESRGNLLEICIRLHNLRTRRVGINQVKELYQACWISTDHDRKVWDDFRGILFSDQRKLDRVSRYHIHAVYELNEDE